MGEARRRKLSGNMKPKTERKKPTRRRMRLNPDDGYILAISIMAGGSRR